MKEQFSKIMTSQKKLLEVLIRNPHLSNLKKTKKPFVETLNEVLHISTALVLVTSIYI